MNIACAKVPRCRPCLRRAGMVAGLFLALVWTLWPNRVWPAFQPNVIRVGTVEIHPSLLAEVVYNDNISLTREKREDLIFKEIPSVSLLWGRTDVPLQGPRVVNLQGLSLDFLLDLYLTRILPLGDRGYLGSGKPTVSVGKPIESAILSGLRLRRYSIVVEYRPEIIHLVNHPQFNSVDHEVTLAGDLRLPGGIYLRLDNAFVSSTAIDSYRKEVVNFTTAQRSEGVGFHTNLLSFSVGYNFYADYLIFLSYTNYLFFLRGFDSGQMLSGAEFPPLLDLELKGVDSGTLGMNLQTVGVYLATVLRKKTALSLGYVWGRLRGNLDDFGFEARFLGDLLPLAASVRGDPRNAYLHEFRLGFQRALTSYQTVFGWPIPKTVLEGSISYQWRDFDSSQIEVEAFGQPVLAVPVPREDFGEFLLDLRILSQLRARTLVTARFSRYPREAVAGGRDVTIDWESALSVSQGIREKLDLDVAGLVRYSDLSYPGASEDSFWYYEGQAALDYRIQNWLSTGVAYQFLARDADMAYNAYRSHRIRLRVLLFF